MGDIAQRGNRLTQKRNKASKEMFKLAQGKRIGKFGGGRTNLLEELGRVEAEPSNRNRRAEIARVHGELNRGYKDGGRTNLLEELGRVEAEPSNRNRRAEISRVHGELNRGYAKGGRAGFASAGQVLKHAKKLVNRVTHEVPTGPHTDVRRRKINPSFINPDVESGRTKEWKRKHGGFKGIAKDVVKGFGKALSKKDGGRIGLKKGGSDKKWRQKVSASIKKRGTK